MYCDTFPQQTRERPAAVQVHNVFSKLRVQSQSFTAATTSAPSTVHSPATTLALPSCLVLPFRWSAPPTEQKSERIHNHINNASPFSHAHPPWPLVLGVGAACGGKGAASPVPASNRADAFLLRREAVPSRDHVSGGRRRGRRRFHRRGPRTRAVPVAWRTFVERPFKCAVHVGGCCDGVCVDVPALRLP